ELLRTLKPGRTCAVHLTQGVAFKGTDGYSGIKDFRGAVIRTMESAGFVYYGEVCIDKCPQLKAIRTKDHGLLFKSLATDASKMHMALADYVLQFRKPGDNPEPIRAGVSEKYGNPDGWITQEEWIEWAAPVWQRQTDKYQRGIRETNVLNVRVAREEKDERHLCPLQLDVIERCVKLWSNPGDLVLSPFAGIGSEGHVALKYNRRFVGVELKRSYFEVACRNLAQSEQQLSFG
ncbi:MAG: DNA methyltransferase, partial [Gammaproteobacteria bacterium]